MSSKSSMKPEKIGVLEKISYGGGDLASNIILVLSSTYVSFFYTDALGLNPAIIGSIIMFSRFADGFTDVLMGYLIDKTKSKHGKCRPWILWLSIPISIAMILIFMGPNIGSAGKYVYVAITYNLVVTFLYTMINIPYGTMTSLLSRDQQERMSINVVRMTMAQLGSLIINSLTLPFVNAVGGSSNQKSWIIVSVVYSIVAAISFIACFVNTKERVKVAQEKQEKLSFGKSLSVCVKNKYWLMLVAVFLFFIFASTFNGAVGTYYAKYIIGNENVMGYLMSVMTIPAIIFIPILAPLTRKIGKRNAAWIGSFVSLAGQGLMLVNPTSFSWLIVCNVIKGIGNATLNGTIFAMVADTIEYGHWKTGTRVEGMLYSSMTFGAKFASGIGNSIALSVLGKAGYDGLAAVQSESALQAIRAFYLYVPMVFMIAICVIYALYKLDGMYPKIIKELTEKGE